MKEERLYIVGYMASGKTTFGRALAAKAGWSFVDLDEEVERRERMTVPEIISNKGEDYFRKAESEALRHTASMTHTVIACGGGTPCWRDNMEFMTLHGMTLWLIASPGRIAERIVAAGATRPLVAGLEGPALLEFVAGHLRRRQPRYCQAMMRLSGERLETPAEIDDAVSSFLKDHPLK